MYSIFIYLILLLFSSVGHSSPVVNGIVCKDKTILDPVQCSRYGSTSSRNRQTKLVSYPFMVFLYISYRSLNDGQKVSKGCGGILIEPNVVLTAGHCMSNEDHLIYKITVLAGTKIIEHEIDPNAQTQQVKAYIVHKKYADFMKTWCGKKYYLSNDLAILWLKESFQITPSVQMAQLPSDFNIEHEYGTAIGWGDTEDGYHSPQLLEAELKVIKNSECGKKLKEYSISKKAFCAVDEDKQSGVSKGDSGSPFIVDNIVYGLVSFGATKKVIRDDGKLVKLCNPIIPQVFTNLYYYKSWIKDTLKSGPPKKTCTKSEKACLL